METTTIFWEESKVSPLHMNLEVSNFQMWMRAPMSIHISKFACLMHIVICMHPLQLVVSLGTLLCSTVTVQQEELNHEDLMELEAQRKDTEKQE